MRGDTSASSKCANGSFRINDSAIDSASRMRPSAKREKARYRSACRAISGALEPLFKMLSADNASSYAADAYRSLAALSGSWARTASSLATKSCR